MENENIKICISIISHGHCGLVKKLLDSIPIFISNEINIELILTVNDKSLEGSYLADVKGLLPNNLSIIENEEPLGFGRNHNLAFKRCNANFYCIANPDILFNEALFNQLRVCLNNLESNVGLLYPLQTDDQGKNLDSKRSLPTPHSIFKRWFLKLRHSERKPDWVNGAIMIFPSSVFRNLNGFDERYFMYCEDVDICLRLQLAGYRMQQIDAAVIHDTRRNTLKNSHHFRWHIRSLLRLWTSKPFWRYWWRLHFAKSKLP